MSELSKQALKVENNTSFPNNNAGLITPSNLRTFNEDMIDSTVNQEVYTADSSSWNQKWDDIAAESGSWGGTLATGSLLVTASSGGTNVITFTKGDLTQFNVTIGTGSATDISSLNAFTASQDTKNSTLATYTGSNDTKWTTLGSQSGSWGATTDISSLNAFTASQETKNSTLATYTGSVNTQLTNLSTSQSIDNAKWVNVGTQSGSWDNTNLNAFTASQNTKNTTLGTWSGSIDTKNTTLASYTGSVNTKFTTIGALTGSYATTGSNTFVGNQTINADLFVSGTINAYKINTTIESSSVIYSSGSNVLGDAANDTQTLNGSVNVVNQLTASGLHYPTADGTSGQFVVTNGAGTLTFDDVHVIAEAVRYGENISIGDPLYVSGSNGNNPIVYKADASNPAKMPVIYIASSTNVANTNTTAISLGLITGVTTTGYPAGTEIFVGEGGGWSSNRPSGSSSIVQPLGIVTKEGSGGSGRGLVLNPGPAVLPNLQTGYAWVGNSGNQPTAVATSSFASVTNLGPLNAFTASQETKNSTLATYTSSVDTKFATIGSQSGSWGGGSINTGSFATTGSNIFIGNQQITGSLGISGATNANGGLFVTGGNLVVQDNNISVNRNLTVGLDATIYGAVSASGTIRTDSNMVIYNQYGGINITANAQGSGSQYPGVNMTVAPNVYPTDIFGGYAIFTELGALAGTTFLGMVANSYSTQYGGTTVPMIIANGNNPDGNDTAIIWTPDGNAEHYKKSIFKYGADVTGSLKINGGLTSSLQQGYVWVGGAGNTTITAPTSSFGGGGGFPYSGTASISGSLQVTGSMSGLVNELSVSSNTASIDFTKGNFFSITLPGGATTRFEVANTIKGQTVNIQINQPAGASTGSVVFSPTILFAGGNDYQATATGSAIDLLTLAAITGSTVLATSIKNFQ